MKLHCSLIYCFSIYDTRKGQACMWVQCWTMCLNLGHLREQFRCWEVTSGSVVALILGSLAENDMSGLNWWDVLVLFLYMSTGKSPETNVSDTGHLRALFFLTSCLTQIWTDEVIFKTLGNNDQPPHYLEIIIERQLLWVLTHKPFKRGFVSWSCVHRI